MTKAQESARFSAERAAKLTIEKAELETRAKKAELKAKKKQQEVRSLASKATLQAEQAGAVEAELRAELARPEKMRWIVPASLLVLAAAPAPSRPASTRCQPGSRGSRLGK